MLGPRTTRRLINPTQAMIIIFLILVIYWFHSMSGDSSMRNLVAANATLGYGHIIAISGPESPRREGLIQAANVTGLHIDIPSQPVWGEEDIAGFKNDGSQMGRGSVLAWMGHLNALNWYGSPDTWSCRFERPLSRRYTTDAQASSSRNSGSSPRNSLIAWY
jgi:hypothetical protein